MNHPFQDHQRKCIFDSYWIQFLFLSVNSEESLFRCEGQLEEPPLARAVVMSHLFFTMAVRHVKGCVTNADTAREDLLLSEKWSFELPGPGGDFCRGMQPD